MSTESTAIAPPRTGLFEHMYGVTDLEGAGRYWAQLGFEPLAEGTLEAERAHELYGVESGLESVRLGHRATQRQGLIRLMRWESAAGEGLKFAHPLDLGSRWSGFYVKDVLEMRDAYRDQAALTGERWDVTDPSRLPVTDQTPSFYDPFVGIREIFVVGGEHRHAFLQRVRFDRPGFGSFADATPLACTEATHGNVVMPSFTTHAFYADALGLVPQAEPMRLDWTMPAIRQSLNMREGQAFTVIVYQVPEVPTGFLRVYGMEGPVEDRRADSRPGQLGLCCYSYAFPAGDLAQRRAVLEAARATDVSAVQTNEFGETSLTFNAPDGYAWHLLEQGP